MAVSGSRFAFVLLILESLLDVTVSYQCYFTYNAWGIEHTTQGFNYCTNGCCGTSPNYYCCNYYYIDYNYGLYGGLTRESIGIIVFGSLVFVTAIVGAIVYKVCRNSKGRRAASSACVKYQSSQGVTIVPVVQGQLNPCGVVYHPAPEVQQSTQPNQVQAGQYPTHGQFLQYPTSEHVLQSSTQGHVLQYPIYLQASQQGQTAHVPIVAQGTGTTVPDQAEKKRKDQPQTHTS